MKWNNLIYGILFSGLGAFSYFLLVDYTNLSPHIADALYSRGAFIYFILTFNVLGYATLRLSSWINTQYAVNMRSRWKIPVIYLAGMSLFLLLNYGLLVSAKILARAANPFSIQPRGWWMLITIWLVELVVLGLLLANRSTQKALRLQQRAAVLQAENDTARYTALQNQLNPHFLFNSLNTLIAEIEYNPQNAVHFTKHLSSVYRYVLQSQDKTLVTLGEELEFNRSYLFLHEVRLGNCLTCQNNVPAEYAEKMLPPLTLQLLVENVIKHNSITPGKPMVITIRIEDDYLSVSNPIHPKKSVASSGIGLENLAKRCELMSGKKIIITAGPTYEKIDPVRFIGNYSSGKMGFALAEECASRGAHVTLISGPVTLKTQHPHIRRIDVESAGEMYEAASREFTDADAGILCAAVADFTPESVADHKIKREKDDLVLQLKPTQDIAASLGKQKKPGQKLVGFALETNDERQNAQGKLERKNFDFIVLNSLNDKGAGFRYDTNKITIIDRQGYTDYPLKSKREVACDIIDKLVRN